MGLCVNLNLMTGSCKSPKSQASTRQLWRQFFVSSCEVHLKLFSSRLFSFIWEFTYLLFVDNLFALQNARCTYLGAHFCHYVQPRVFFSACACVGQVIMVRWSCYHIIFNGQTPLVYHIRIIPSSPSFLELLMELQVASLLFNVCVELWLYFLFWWCTVWQEQGQCMYSVSVSKRFSSQQ